MSRAVGLAGIAALAVGVAMTGSALAGDDPAPLPCDTHVTDIPAPDGWTVVTDCDTATDLSGQTDMRTQVVTVWPAAHTDPDALVWTWLHELGHAYDAAVLNDAGRERWRVWRGLPAGPWQHLHGGGELDRQAWQASPGEDWAEAFAFCHKPDRDLTRIPGFVPPGERECEFVAAVALITRRPW
jgi:hypothetical protein